MYDVNHNMAGYLALLTQKHSNEIHMFSDEEIEDKEEMVGPHMTDMQFVAVCIVLGICVLVLLLFAASWLLNKPSANTSILSSSGVSHNSINDKKIELIN